MAKRQKKPVGVMPSFEVTELLRKQRDLVCYIIGSTDWTRMAHGEMVRIRAEMLLCDISDAELEIQRVLGRVRRQIAAVSELIRQADPLTALTSAKTDGGASSDAKRS